MKAKALLKCIGLICIWFLSLQFFSILFRNADITRILSILIVGILVFCMNRKNHYICFVPEEKPRMQIILLALLSGIGLSFFNMISALQFMLSGAMEEMAQVQTDDVSISLLYIVLSVAGAVVEELFFRGILLNLCRPYDRAASAIIISAVLFAVMHLSPLMMLHTFISGLVFGYFYYHTENIYIPILMHLTNNLLWSTALNAWLFGPFMLLTGELQGAVIMVVAGLVMVICSTAVFHIKYRKQS